MAGKQGGAAMRYLKQLWRDSRGDAVVEAAMLFPIMILICAALVLLSIYMPLRAAMQRSTQYAATAIATERSDTWLRHNPDSLSYGWITDKSQLGNVYASLIGALVGNNRDDADNAEIAVKNMEKKNILKPSSDLTVEYGVVNYIIYKEIVVTASRSVPVPLNLTMFGIPRRVELTVTSIAVVQNGDEFIRNMDLAVEIMDDLFDLSETFSGLTKICGKFNDFLGI